MKVQVLISPGCGHGTRTLELVADVVRQHAPSAEVEAIVVATRDEAARLSFPGSPTVRVDGVDVEPHSPTDVALG